MDVEDLMLQYVPYCIFKHIRDCLDYAVEHYSSHVASWLENEHLVTSGLSLYDKLCDKSWSCNDLLTKIEELGDHDLLTSYEKAIQVYKDIERQQCLMSANAALQNRIDELNLINRLQHQELNNQQPITNMAPITLSSGVYGPPSPIPLIEDNPEEIEFG